MVAAMRLSQLIDGAGGGLLLLPRFEGIGWRGRRLDFDRPQLDQPGIVLAIRLVRDLGVGGEDQSVCGRRLGKDAIDGLEHRLGRAEGEGERHVVPDERERVRPLPEFAADLAEPHRIRALETVDRLLLVADREQRAQPVASSGARKEFRRQILDDGPLRRICVLRLVDENVVDPAVDLEQHPGRGFGARQEVLRLVDQVVVIERDLHELLPVVLASHGVGQRKHGSACFGHAEMGESVVQRGETRLRLLEPRDERGLGACEGHGENLA